MDESTETKTVPRSFYLKDDVVNLSKKLLGKILCTRINGTPKTTGIIVETEAYAGRGDRACHANNGNRTDRNEAMFRKGGIAYVYLCYGIHHLFNVVTNTEGKADAVLVRAIEPAEGIETMVKRRNADKLNKKLTSGPGRLTQALGIDMRHYGIQLQSPPVWIEDRDVFVKENQIACSPRIGVNYAGEDAQKPWRFFLKESKWVSR